MKVLVIQQKMIGDVLVSSLLCEHLKQELPQCEVHYLINEHTLAVVENNPYIDTIVLFKKEEQKSKVKFYLFLKNLAIQKYAIVIDFYGKLESNLMSLSSGAKTRISHKKWYSRYIYTHIISADAIDKEKMGHTIDHRLAFLSPILPKIKNPTKQPKIYLTAVEIDKAKSFLLDKGISFSKPILMISILGSSTRKTYPLEYMAEVIDKIAARNDSTILFNYIPDQHSQARQLYDLCSTESKSKIEYDVFAPSLRDFLGILHHCSALIGNEGGAVNMAKALDIPTFAIYSPLISKFGWHTFSYNNTNRAVHLGDYSPEMVQGKSKKELKKNLGTLYDRFKPQLFQSALSTFLNDKVF